jgi:hypothetical protein
MFGRFRHFLPIAAWAMGIASVWPVVPQSEALPQPGYLPQAGPEPLRFKVIVPLPTAPPSPPPVQPAISLPSPPIQPEAKESSNVPPIKSLTNGPAIEFNAREPVKEPVPTTPDTVLSPQMLIKYFAAPTNAPSGNIPAPGTPLVSPVGFTPPLTAPTPAAAPPPANKTP